MKIQMTGTRVRQIREALGMTVPQFAAVIAVHPGTVHRWEGVGDLAVPIDGVAAGLLVALDTKYQETPKRRTATAFQGVGQEVAQILVVGGALLALAALIGWAVEDRRR